MSVNDLLDLLEDLVNENTKPGFSGKCVLKSKDILSIINDMRAQLPTEIQAANHVRREKNKLTAPRPSIGSILSLSSAGEIKLPSFRTQGN